MAIFTATTINAKLKQKAMESVDHLVTLIAMPQLIHMFRIMASIITFQPFYFNPGKCYSH